MRIEEAPVENSPSQKSSESLPPDIQEGINIVTAGDFKRLDSFLATHPGARTDSNFLRAVGKRMMAIPHLKDAAEHIEEIKYLDALFFNRSN